MQNKKIFIDVKKFYNIYPYPNQKITSKQDLFNPKHEFIMKKILNAANLKKSNISNFSILDAGCGTGEKSLYLALFSSDVDAFDLSSNSIKIAKKNAKLLKIKVNFFVSSFETFQTTKKYDLIICIGALHHSADPKKNFIKLSKFLKKNGVIVLGLYHPFGRIFVRLKRFLFKLLFSNPKKIVRFLKIFFRPKTKTGLILLADKYATPFESYHRIEEVLQWLKEANLQLLKIYPEIKTEGGLSLIFAQLRWLLFSKGFFFISAKKQNIK